MKEYCYFKHDSNARNDDKLLRVRIEHGAEGYGVFWMILERLREEENYMADTNYAAIAFDLHVKEELVKSVVEDFDLFVVEAGKFWSENFRRMMKEKDAIRTMNSEKAKKRWAGEDGKNGNTGEDADMPRHTKTDAAASKNYAAASKNYAEASKNYAEAYENESSGNAKAQNKACSGNAAALKNDATAMPRHEKSEQVKLSISLNNNPPHLKVEGVQGEEENSLSQKPEKTPENRGTLEAVTKMQGRLESKGCNATDIDRFIRLTDLGTDADTEEMLQRIESAGDAQKELTNLNEVMAGEERSGARTSTTCYSAVKATVLLRIVDDESVRERIIDTFRTGTLEEKAKASNRVIELANEIKRKKGTDREIAHPTRYIAKMLGITI